MTPDAAVPLDEFEVEQRIEVHPATELWMQGFRFGIVRKVGREKLTVEVNRLGATLTVTLRPRDVQRITHTADGRPV